MQENKLNEECFNKMCMYLSTWSIKHDKAYGVKVEDILTELKAPASIYPFNLELNHLKQISKSILDSKPFIKYEVYKSDKSKSLYLHMQYREQHITCRFSNHRHPVHHDRPYFKCNMCDWVFVADVEKYIKCAIKILYKKAIDNLGKMEMSNEFKRNLV